MDKKFNDNLLRALETSEKAIKHCRQALIDANDESCRAMYTAIMKDCERHIKMLKGEVDFHKAQKKWE